MLRVHHVARSRRFVPLVVLALALSACGPDLGKQNFPRTTVTASSDAVPDGPIDDPKVSAEVQRTVDPCALLAGDTVTDIGTPDEDSLSETGLDACSVTVTDAGGKDLRLRLDLGTSPGINPQAVGAVEGLPLIEQPSEDDDTVCFVYAMTSRDPAMAIGFQVTYSGGDPCGAGTTALRKVVAKMHAGPPEQNRPAGSVVPLDPCALIDPATATEVLGGDTTGNPAGLHDCYWSGGNATGYLRISDRVVPVEGEDGVRIDLGGGITAFQKEANVSGKSCEIAWTHLPTKDGYGEVVKFEYDNFHDDAANDDACGKARRVVDTIVPKLPRV